MRSRERRPLPSRLRRATFPRGEGFGIAIDNKLCQQAHRQGGKEIYCRVLLDEHSGKTDENNSHHNKGLPPDIRPFFLGPHRGKAQGVGHMKRGTHAGIGVQGVEDLDALGQEIVPGEFRGPQILAAGEENINGHGSHQHCLCRLSWFK